MVTQREMGYFRKILQQVQVSDFAQDQFRMFWIGFPGTLPLLEEFTPTCLPGPSVYAGLLQHETSYFCKIIVKMHASVCSL